MTNIDEKIKQYHELKKIEKTLSTRLKDLKAEIKSYVFQNAGEVTVGNLTAKVQSKHRYDYDKVVLEDILWKKGLWDQCSKRVIDEDAVEQAFYSGDLTDNDIRQCKLTTDIVALLVEEGDNSSTNQQ